MKLSFTVLLAGLSIGVAAQAQDLLRNPDPEAFGADQTRPLLADRNQPQTFPTLEARDDDGGALDGATPGETLDQKSQDAGAQALFTALAAQNCRIARHEVGNRLGPLGFDPETVTDTLARLYVEGIASLDAQGVLTLPPSICPPDEMAPNPRDAVLAAFRDNGCTASEDQMQAAPGISDLSEQQLLAILGPMRDRGEIETGTLQATLSPELCQED